MDEINGTLLPDGSFKLTTGKISAPNHAKAEGLLRLFQNLLGGAVISKKDAHAHLHEHAVEHTHEHE